MTEKHLVLIRGLPGSGKTSLAKFLSESCGFFVCSIDEYFTDEFGKYSFDYKKNHLAYKACENKAESAMQAEHPKVLVENTFTLEWELLPYLRLAERYGYKHFVCTLENRHGGENVHEIADEQLLKMANGFQVKLLPERLEK